MKVFVSKFDGDKALVSFMYGDSWSPYLVNTIDTKDLLIEDNIVYHTAFL